MDLGFWQILWTACGLVTIVAALLAGRSAMWRQIGRVATGVLFLIGGALMHVVNLATGGDYATFADPALFQWVTDSWRTVVGPNQLLFIGLLIAFEATIGLLVFSGGRRTQLGYYGIIAFYLALWIFGPMELVFVLLMLVPMVLLLRAEQRAEALATPPSTGQTQRPVHAG
jgi:hypothetical protein